MDRRSMKERRKFWFFPIILVMLLLGGLIVTIIAFDCVAYVAYFVIPVHMQILFPDYHQPLVQVGGRGHYPQGYFVAHDERSFEIGKDKSGSHFVKGFGSYNIWSNSLGCFDTNEPAKMTAGEFIYLAGDSFTWGYAPYETKFGTLLESNLVLPVLKCGVTHSGQRHQFAKFKEITESLGRNPRLVVINYTGNDVANDYAYPHSTVVEGWLVDKVGLSEKQEIVRIDEETLRKKVKKRLARQVLLREYARAYSLSYNLLNGIYRKVTSATRGVGREPGNRLKNMYELTAVTGGINSYDNQYAQPNKEVLALWHAHAKQHLYLLIVSLIPPRAHVSQDYYRELEQFLREEGIPFVNFTDYMIRNNMRPDDLYWTADDHFNLNGNRQYANFLLSVIQEAIVRKLPLN